MPDLHEFQNVHRDETIVVCGCGESLNDFAHPERFVTIGVNDVGRRFDPTYLVVVNPRSQFSADRFRYIEHTRARYVFTQLDLGLPRDRIIRFRLGRYGGTTFTDPNVLHYTRNSPYVATCLAVHLGARRIGLIGVDFTDRHFFGTAGRHALAPHLEGIDAEYRRLAEALSKMGIEVVNLSRVSRVTALPKRPDLLEDQEQRTTPRDRPPCAPAARPEPKPPRIFGVTYQFLSCREVFTDGLRHAAEALGVEWADAPWDDRRLPARVAAFAPDLLFIVHGRRFAQRWNGALSGYRKAVWLLDEPYEVDDTASFSGAFDHVFVNDAATLGRHARAHYLPVCHDPTVHRPGDLPRTHDVGFIGGGNPTRERLLIALADRGLLSYVVGGPWHDPRLARLSLSANIPAGETAALYRSTKIVVNVFRDRHHFNKAGVGATSMNPRIYEALACGALVVSETRPEIAAVVPELPVFHDEQGLVSVVERYLSNPGELEAAASACRARLTNATYADRLKTVMATTLGIAETGPAALVTDVPVPRDPDPPRPAWTGDGDWEVCGPVGCSERDGQIELQCTRPAGPGSERGLVTTRSHEDVMLAFDLFLSASACFVAKIHQADRFDQCANSYHVHLDGGRAYLARHFCVFKTFGLPCDEWVPLELGFAAGVLSVSAGGRLVHSVRDQLLPRGFAVLSIKRGNVKLRNVRLSHANQPIFVAPAVREGELIVPGDATLRPRISVVTTVYDRIDCLAHCIRSVRHQRLPDYEHIVVSDCPPPESVDRITSLVRSFADGRISYLNLDKRHNNWGIAPAAAGLRRAQGEYVCFLSDDNGYTPEHLLTLASVLDDEPDLGFAYSSCRYAGRLVLRHPVPAPARIDLGQPMFRRGLFTAYLDDDLPFDMMAWDWALIDSFVQRGVRWRHVDVPSFIFRLARYPQLMVKA